MLLPKHRFRLTLKVYMLSDVIQHGQASYNYFSSTNRIESFFFDFVYFVDLFHCCSDTTVCLLFVYLRSTVAIATILTRLQR